MDRVWVIRNYPRVDTSLKFSEDIFESNLQQKPPENEDSVSNPTLLEAPELLIYPELYFLLSKHFNQK